MLGRVGGDEFVVFLKGIGLDAAIAKGLSRSGSPWRTCGSRAWTGPSPPASAFMPPGRATRRYRDVFLRADEALYDAKRKGKGRVVAYGEQEA